MMKIDFFSFIKLLKEIEKNMFIKSRNHIYYTTKYKCIIDYKKMN